jgi:hypothetical protein
MHQGIFNYKDSDVNDLKINFYDCVLERPIFDYPVGTTFARIQMDYFRALMTVFHDTGVETYKMNLILIKG